MLNTQDEKQQTLKQNSSSNLNATLLFTHQTAHDPYVHRQLSIDSSCQMNINYNINK